MERKWPRLDASRSHGSAPLREGQYNAPMLSQHVTVSRSVVVLILVLKDVRPDKLSDCEPMIVESRWFLGIIKNLSEV